LTLAHHTTTPRTPRLQTRPPGPSWELFDIYILPEFRILPVLASLLRTIPPLFEHPPFVTMRYNAEDVFSSSPLSTLAPSPRKPRDTRDWPTRLEEEEEEEDLPESSGAGARRAADRLAAALAGKEEGTGTEKGASRDLPEEEEAKEYEVERILGRKEHRGEIRYKIRWVR
jgi:hypothetical protein